VKSLSACTTPGIERWTDDFDEARASASSLMLVQVVSACPFLEQPATTYCCVSRLSSEFGAIVAIGSDSAFLYESSHLQDLTRGSAVKAHALKDLIVTSHAHF
jgi:hypothetical protein